MEVETDENQQLVDNQFIIIDDFEGDVNFPRASASDINAIAVNGRHEFERHKKKRDMDDYLTKEEVEDKQMDEEEPPDAFPTTKTHIKHIYDTTQSLLNTPFCVKPVYKSKDWEYVNKANCSNGFYVTDLNGKNDMTREEALDDMKRWNGVTDDLETPIFVRDKNGDVRDISDPCLQPNPDIRIAMAVGQLEKTEKLVKNMQDHEIDHLFPVYDSAKIRAAKIMSQDPTKKKISWAHSIPVVE